MEWLSKPEVFCLVFAALGGCLYVMDCWSKDSPADVAGSVKFSVLAGSLTYAAIYVWSGMTVPASAQISEILEEAVFSGVPQF